MKALDTNTLVRFLVRDDEAQFQQVLARFQAAAAVGEVFLVGDVALAELVWVLQRRYRCTGREIEAAIDVLLDVPELVFESTDRVRRALRAYERSSADFADHLLLECARDAQCDGLLTFDKALLEQPGCVAP